MINFLPLQSITASFEPELSAAVNRVIGAGWYLNGSECAAFEQEFADFLGSRYVVGVGNGLDALTLSLLALKEKYALPDDAEVILPDMTFIATAEAVVRAGLVPIMVDVSDSCGVLTCDTILSGLSPRTRIVLPVHLYGYPAPMSDICNLAEEHHLLVLEDAAQAHGAQVDGRRVGHWGHLAAFSFYPGKNLGALGDGGAVATDDSELAYLVRVLANYGAEKKYYHTRLGFNSRLDEIQAAVLRVKLHRLDKDNEARRHVARLYSSRIINPLVRLPFEGDTSQSVFHIYPLRTPYRQLLQNFLAENGIESLIHYPSTVSHQEAMKPYILSSRMSNSYANTWAEQEISIPISPLMSFEETMYVIEIINSFSNNIEQNI